LRVKSSVFRVYEFMGSGIQGFRVQALRINAQGLGFRVWDFGYRLKGLGFRVEG
jgi:hypothetical protein